MYELNTAPKPAHGTVYQLKLNGEIKGEFYDGATARLVVALLNANNAQALHVARQAG